MLQRRVRPAAAGAAGRHSQAPREAGRSRHEVECQGHDFLGLVALSHERSQRFVVDAQQRLSRH